MNSSGWTQAHPPAEWLRGRPLTALHQCDQQADALSVFQKGQAGAGRVAGHRPWATAHNATRPSWSTIHRPPRPSRRRTSRPARGSHAEIEQQSRRSRSQTRKGAALRRGHDPRVR
ncbi:BTAD domain-containing putative transcriptional regulator [Streptomyces sp. Edi4]|uniref:BTAD domain-containing putative transcriptional regulator n=1 Tax=Streptomyces sp. Edi4 TaxID=3162527 RepID=UPI0033059E58